MACRLTLLLALLAVPVAATSAMQDSLSEARALVYEDQFIEAYLALEPLLTTDEQSEAQEEALWLADRLCAYVTTSDHLYSRFDAETPDDVTWDSGRAVALQAWGFIAELNSLGADFEWDHFGGGYEYRHAFARRLVALYPESRHAAAASYYAIRPGYNDRENVERWVADLEGYLARYGDSNTIEAARARHTLAGIYDDLWQLLTHRYDSAEAREYTTDDGEADARRAHEYRILALRLYTDCLLLQGRAYPRVSLERVVRRSRALRRGEEDGSWYILND